MALKFNFNLKEPKKQESLLMFLCRWNNQQIKVSTKQRVVVATWDMENQTCIISKDRFTPRVNKQSKRINGFIKDLSDAFIRYYDESYDCSISNESAKLSIQKIIESILDKVKEQDERLKMTPLHFFEDYIERKRIDPHTGRYINERTKIHQRTVLHRLQSFIQDCNLPDDFSTFTSKKFDSQFSDWCYSTKHYKENTIYATYGVLKPLLNAAKEEGFEIADNYKYLKGKCKDVDAIYLTEDEIKRIYELDIPKLKEFGEIDVRSTIEQTRDLFIISCWTALRRSDINRLDKATRWTD